MRAKEPCCETGNISVFCRVIFFRIWPEVLQVSVWNELGWVHWPQNRGDLCFRSRYLRQSPRGGKKGELVNGIVHRWLYHFSRLQSYRWWKLHIDRWKRFFDWIHQVRCQLLQCWPVQWSQSDNDQRHHTDDMRLCYFFRWLKTVICVLR